MGAARFLIVDRDAVRPQPLGGCGDRVEWGQASVPTGEEQQRVPRSRALPQLEHPADDDVVGAALIDSMHLAPYRGERADQPRGPVPLLKAVLGLWMIAPPAGIV